MVQHPILKGIPRLTAVCLYLSSLISGLSFQIPNSKLQIQKFLIFSIWLMLANFPCSYRLFTWENMELEGKKEVFCPAAWHTIGEGKSGDV